jgi:hypothetical protein
VKNESRVFDHSKARHLMQQIGVSSAKQFAPGSTR